MALSADDFNAHSLGGGEEKFKMMFGERSSFRLVWEFWVIFLYVYTKKKFISMPSREFKSIASILRIAASGLCHKFYD